MFLAETGTSGILLLTEMITQQGDLGVTMTAARFMVIKPPISSLSWSIQYY